MKRIATALLVLPLVALAASSCASKAADDKESSVDGVNPADLGKNPIQGVGAPKMLIDTGAYTDGPVWHTGEAVLFFTVPIGDGDTPGLYRVKADGAAMKVRGGSMKTGDLPVGNAVNKAGELLTVEAKRLLRGGADGNQAPIATGYPGAKGNTPFDTLNDAVVHKNGTVYVTDPGYFADPPPDTNRLYRIAPDGAISVADQFQNVPRPNGVALSPDQKILYVGFERPAAGLKPYIEKYNVRDDGSLAEHAHFVELDIDSSPDGVEVDYAGNVYVANKAGVTVWNKDAKKIGNVAVPDQPTGLAFGGDGNKTLFITTAGTKIYTLKVNVPGIPQ